MTANKQNSETRSATLLGIETSGVTCALGISRDNQLTAEIAVNIKNIHSEKLAPFFEQILETSGINVTGLNAIVLSAGPGSFTGLRIGYSFAKGLAFALNLPLIEVSTLDVWAYQNGPRALPIVSVIDAHRGEIFCAAYRLEGAILHRDSEYLLTAIDKISEHFSAPVTACGADAIKLQALLEPNLPEGSRILSPASPTPQIWALLTLGWQQYQQQSFADLSDSEPFYLRAFRGVS